MNLRKLQKAHATFGRLMGGRRYEDVALRRAGELLRQIEPQSQSQLKQYRQEGDHLPVTRITEQILEQLNQIGETPWGDMRGKPLDSRGLSRRLAKYGVKPKLVRIRVA